MDFRGIALTFFCFAALQGCSSGESNAANGDDCIKKKATAIFGAQFAQNDYPQNRKLLYSRYKYVSGESELRAVLAEIVSRRNDCWLYPGASIVGKQRVVTFMIFCRTAKDSEFYAYNFSFSFDEDSALASVGYLSLNIARNDIPRDLGLLKSG